jgi:uncharacterized protein (TIGR02246 family)
MRVRKRWMLPLILLAAAGCAGGAKTSTTPAVDQTAIGAKVDSVNAAYAAAIAQRDTNAAVGLYADDAHMMPANMPRADGKDAIRKVWVGLLSMPGLDLKITSNSKIVSEAGDMAIDLGTYTFAAKDPKGKPMTDHGKYVTVLKNVNGQWKILIDTWNSDVMPPGM